MKRWVSGLLCLCCTLPAVVGAQAVPAEPISSEDYRRIEAAREREGANFDAQEAACYQRFAVNDCLKKVQSKRRAVMADLKHQEARLHERERQQQGIEAVQRIEQKALERQQKQDEQHAEDGTGRARDKLQEQQSKQAEHAAKAASDSASSTAPVPSRKTAAEQAQARADYERKQADAEKKRKEIAKRQAEKAAKPVKPLPSSP